MIELNKMPTPERMDRFQIYILGWGNIFRNKILSIFKMLVTSY